MTIAAATNLHYPPQYLNIYILDDGRRPALKKLCHDYNIHYITRDNNIGAKAGNINHALPLINGELFAVLDADMIVKPEFLQKTVGYFHDHNVAFVQTPQVYYNPDIYQYNLHLNIPNEQDYFMRDVQYFRAAKNAVLHVGTNAIFRRRYVLDIGSYPTCSITEDMAVGMLLQSRGYDSVFVNEELVYGLSASTLPELIKQRDRWCRGNIQVLRHYHPFFTKGLSLSQKIVYFDGVLFWFCNWQKLIFILCPLLYLIFDLTILDGSIVSLFCFYFPYYFSQLLMTSLLSCHHRPLRWGHYYEMVMSPYLTASIFNELFHVKSHFAVTEKNVILDHPHFYFHLAKRHIILIILTILAWIIAFIKMYFHMMPLVSFYLNFLWSAYNAIGMIIAILVAWQKPLYRQCERIKIKDQVNIEMLYRQQRLLVQVIDLSSRGICLKINHPVSFNPYEKITLYWDNYHFDCFFVRQNKQFISFQFSALTASQMRFLMKIFCHNLSTYFKIDIKPNQYKQTGKNS